jgi:ribosomal protein L40E
MFGIIIGIVAWIIFLIVCVNIGKEKNRNGFLWGLFFGPFGLLILAILPKIQIQKSMVTSYTNNNTRLSNESYIPSFIRKQESKPVSLSEIPKIAIGNNIEESNLYYNNDIKSNKWLCSKCGNINKLKDESCKKCGNEKSVLKINKEDI